MLSILIPVYNYDIRNFVCELRKQAADCAAKYEIRCYDDCSSSKYQEVNREISQLPNVIYKELEKNIGRSAIRNLLAEDAAYNYVLFLDCDSMPENKDFIKKYIDNLKPDALLYGGRSYDKQKPDVNNLIFRWTYGIKREVIPVNIRNKKPYNSFQTNNFIIPKDIFLKIRLNEKLNGYGHEDTLFGNDLRKENIPIVHIDNPLRHLGLETTEEFVNKTSQGIDNLIYLLNNNYDVSNVRLAVLFKRLRKMKLLKFTAFFISLFNKRCENNFTSLRPSIKLFDIYKLGLMISQYHKN